MIRQFLSATVRTGASSRKPSAYPAAFHAIRLGQLLSSLIVAAVLIFLIDHLHDEGYGVPWTFILLLTTSLLTLLQLAIGAYIDLTRTLNPSSHLISNAVLTIAWLVSLALLTWNLSWTLRHRCVVTQWRNQVGVMICRMYKAMAAFAVCGTAATLCALGLDILISWKGKERGFYNTMEDVKTPNIRLCEVGGVEGNGGDAFENQRFGEGWERSHEGARDYKVQRPIEANSFGYEQLTEQTRYGGGGGGSMI